MAESSLTPTLTNLRNAVTREVHGGTGDYSVLAADDQAQVNAIVQKGIKRFYAPPAVDNRVHHWSFLNRIATLTFEPPYSTGTIVVVAGVATLTGGTFPANAAASVLRVEGTDYPVATRDSPTQLTLDDLTVAFDAGTEYSLVQDDYDLPDNFDSFASELITYAQSESAMTPIKIVEESAIRIRRQSYSSNQGSHPYWVALRQKTFDPAVGVRMEALFWPSVSEEAIVTYKYRQRADDLTTAAYFAHGASDHADTIEAACLAIAEMEIKGQRGMRWSDFMDCLRSSIERDGKKRNGSLGFAKDQERTGFIDYPLTRSDHVEFNF